MQPKPTSLPTNFAKKGKEIEDYIKSISGLVEGTYGLKVGNKFTTPYHDGVQVVVGVVTA